MEDSRVGNGRVRRSFPEKIAFAAGLFLVGGLLAVLYLFNPMTSAYFPPCPFHYLTGLYCPGCGSLRAVHFLLNGNLTGAVAMNPLLVASLPIFTVVAFKRSWLYKGWLPLFVLIIIILFGVLRNIPAWPFLLLAPHY